jgi:hypothetical protein
MDEFILENFDFKNNYKDAKIVFIIFIVFFVILYFLSLYVIIYFYETKNFKCLYIYLILLLCPTIFTQLICFFWALTLICMKRNNIKKSTLHITSFGFFTLVYAISCYIFIVIYLYLLTNISLFDFKNKELYTKPIIELDELIKKKIILKKHKSKIEKQSQEGKNNVKDKKIVMGFLLKDSTIHISSMQKKIKEMGKYFKDYKVVLFENDSKDGTRDILNEWSLHDKHIDIIKCCDLGDCECRLNWKDLKSKGPISDFRIDKMRFMRERMLRHVSKNYSHYDYYMIMDFDISGSLFIDGFFTTFHHNNWDMVFSNGLNSSPIPFFHNKLYLYDILAYVPYDHKQIEYSKSNYQNIIDFFRENKKLEINLKNLKWKEAKSGFNGLAIYKMKSVKNCSYLNNKKFYCEHIDIHNNMIENSYEKIYFNPSIIMFPGQQCEHRLKMISKMFSKIFLKK